MSTHIHGPGIFLHDGTGAGVQAWAGRTCGNSDGSNLRTACFFLCLCFSLYIIMIVRFRPLLFRAIHLVHKLACTATTHTYIHTYRANIQSSHFSTMNIAVKNPRHRSRCVTIPPLLPSLASALLLYHTPPSSHTRQSPFPPSAECRKAPNHRSPSSGGAWRSHANTWPPGCGVGNLTLTGRDGPVALGKRSGQARRRASQPDHTIAWRTQGQGAMR